MKNQIVFLGGLLLIAAIFALLTGCVPITSNLKLNPKAGTASWSSPKDCTVESIEVGESTNGTPYMVIHNWRSSNNPQVIDAKGQADAMVAKQWGENIVNAVAAGASLASTMGTQAAAGKLANAVAGQMNPATTPAVKPVTPPTQ